MKTAISPATDGLLYDVLSMLCQLTKRFCDEHLMLYFIFSLNKKRRTIKQFRPFAKSYSTRAMVLTKKFSLVPPSYWSLEKLLVPKVPECIGNVTELCARRGQFPWRLNFLVRVSPKFLVQYCSAICVRMISIELVVLLCTSSTKCI